MSNIIQNQLALILGDTWSWKTYFWVFLASFYNRIYSNVKVQKHNKKISTDIADISEAKGIPYKNEKWVLLVDEWGVNLDSRNTLTEENKQAGELLFLWRKKNIDIIVISQLLRRIDINFRELSNLIVEMSAIPCWNNYLKFKAEVYKRSNSQMWNNSLNLTDSSIYDLFLYTKLTWINYDTLDTSKLKKIQKTENLKSKRKKNDKNNNT